MRSRTIAAASSSLVFVVACSLGFNRGDFVGEIDDGGSDGTAPNTLDGSDATTIVPGTDGGGLPITEGGGAPCLAPGATCANGTIFAGRVGAKNLYTTPCDYGQTWSGTSCTGQRSELPFNNGNDEGAVFTNVTTDNDGAANTAALITFDSDSVTAGVQPHRAAQACADLVFGGFDDWFLPAVAEMEALYENRLAIKNFSIQGADPPFYQTSTETHDGSDPYNNARIRMSDGYVYGDGNAKAAEQILRCTRHDP